MIDIEIIDDETDEYLDSGALTFVPTCGMIIGLGPYDGSAEEVKWYCIGGRAPIARAYSHKGVQFCSVKLFAQRCKMPSAEAYSLAQKI